MENMDSYGELRLQIGNTEFKFWFNGLGNGLHDDEIRSCWCLIGLTVLNHYFNFKDYGETMTVEEVVYLRDRLNNLLRGELSEDVYIAFIEPDFEFILYPKLDLRTLKNVIVKEGHEFKDISVKFIINLSTGSIWRNAEQYIIPFDREEVELLALYLDNIIPQLKVDWERANNT